MKFRNSEDTVLFSSSSYVFCEELSKFVHLLFEQQAMHYCSCEKCYSSINDTCFVDIEASIEKFRVAMVVEDSPRCLLSNGESLCL